MRLYPDVPRRRVATIAGDAALVLVVLLFAWLGSAVHDSVEDLTAVSQGVQEIGGTVESTLGRAGDAVGRVPVVGGQLSDVLRDAGRGTGGRAVEAGREGEQSVNELADLLGWLFFGVPTVLLVSRLLPPRIAQVRRLTAAQRVLSAGATHEQRALLARRAAFGLPYTTLLRHTADPLGDLSAGRLEPLLAAVRDDAGLARER